MMVSIALSDYLEKAALELAVCSNVAKVVSIHIKSVHALAYFDGGIAHYINSRHFHHYVRAHRPARPGDPKAAHTENKALVVRQRTMCKK